MNFKRNLKRGMSGPDVRALKDRLKALCYLHASTHDTFGADTRRAVMAFQTAAGLAADGIAGEATWAALFSETAAGEPAASAPQPAAAQPSDKALAACSWALTRIGDVYVWGGNGMTDLADAKIAAKDDAAGAARSVRFRNRQLGYGITGLRGYDCSGFVSSAYREAGAWDARRDCDGLWTLCTEVNRSALLPGDLLFRVSSSNASDETHVGLYLGRGLVIHAKGRDVGVVVEGINQGGSGYWHKAGRFKPAYA